MDLNGNFDFNKFIEVHEGDEQESGQGQVANIRKQMGPASLISPSPALKNNMKPTPSSSSLHSSGIPSNQGGFKHRSGVTPGSMKQGAVVKARLPDDILAKMGSKGPTAQSSMQKDKEAIATLSKKIQHLEAVNQSAKLELREKNLRNDKLKKEISEMKALEFGSPENMQEMLDLREERDNFKSQVEEMKKFLSDYGLNWVGGEAGQHEGAPNPTLPSEIDTEVLTRRIEELNFIAEKNLTVENKNGVNQFKTLDPVQIFFYQNGVMIKGWPFYPYTGKEAQSILSDILDGFFPVDLKQKYPDGVALKPVDFCDQPYDESASVQMKEQKVQKMSDMNGPLQMQGRRDDLEKKFRETGFVETNKLSSKEPIQVDSHVNEETDPAEIVNLRIRTESGKRTIMIKMLKSDSIDKVYELVEAFSETGDIQKFELRTNFPKRVFKFGETGQKKNLKELGLAPSSALIMNSIIV